MVEGDVVMAMTEDRFIETIKQALSLSDVVTRRELFLGFENTEEFGMYERGEIEFQEAFESYLAQI